MVASYTIREADKIEHKIVYNYPLTAFEELATNGSGIRRAKDTLLENGSPELKFYPDNEEDNYTNAVMGINAEFLKESITQETTQETTQEIKIEKSVPNKIIGDSLC